MNPPEGLSVTVVDRTPDAVTYRAVLALPEAVKRGLHRIVTATRWLAQARLDEARVQAARLDPDVPLGADRDLAMVLAYGLEAVSHAGPDERAVLVRASILLDHGVAAADVTRALGDWAVRFPTLIGTAPRVHARTETGYRAEPTRWHQARTAGDW